MRFKVGDRLNYKNTTTYRGVKYSRVDAYVKSVNETHYTLQYIDSIGTSKFLITYIDKNYDVDKRYERFLKLKDILK